MAWRSCTECLQGNQGSQMMSVNCRDGSVVDTGLTGYEAANFLILDGGNFCRRCGEHLQTRHCTSIDTRRPTLDAEPIGGSGMRSATGGRKDRVATAVDWLTYII